MTLMEPGRNLRLPVLKSAKYEYSLTLSDTRTRAIANCSS